jgi:hypothetical protein
MDEWSVGNMVIGIKKQVMIKKGRIAFAPS